MTTLSAIASGAAFVPSTDQLVTVRNGTTDVLTTLPTITPQALTWGATIAWNAANGTNVTITATSNINFTLDLPSNLAAGMGGVIYVKQFSTGGQVITWASGYRGIGGTKPVLSTGNNNIDEIGWFSPDGTHVDLRAINANYS